MCEQYHTLSHVSREELLVLASNSTKFTKLRDRIRQLHQSYGQEQDQDNGYEGNMIGRKVKQPKSDSDNKTMEYEHMHSSEDDVSTRAAAESKAEALSGSTTCPLPAKPLPATLADNSLSPRGAGLESNDEEAAGDAACGPDLGLCAGSEPASQPSDRFSYDTANGDNSDEVMIRTKRAYFMDSDDSDDARASASAGTAPGPVAVADSSADMDPSSHSNKRSRSRSRSRSTSPTLVPVDGSSSTQQLPPLSSFFTDSTIGGEEDASESEGGDIGGGDTDTGGEDATDSEGEGNVDSDSADGAETDSDTDNDAGDTESGSSDGDDSSSSDDGSSDDGDECRNDKGKKRKDRKKLGRGGQDKRAGGISGEKDKIVREKAKAKKERKQRKKGEKKDKDRRKKKDRNEKKKLKRKGPVKVG